MKADASNSPWVYPIRVDQAGRFHFVTLSPEAFRREPFHDRRLEGRYPATGSVDLDQIADTALRWDGDPPPGFIFHHAFALSTLLSRLLEGPTVLGIREPSVLTDLSLLDLADRAALSSPAGQRLLRAALAVLCRTEAPVRHVVIKGCDSLTGMIPTLLSQAGGAAGILLYSDLETFVLACRSANRSQWARDRLAAFRAWELPDALATADPARLSDAEVAACLWAMQMVQYARFVVEFPSRLLPVHCERLVAAPRETLIEIAAFLGLDGDSADLGLRVDFARHAKTGAPFGPDRRAAELAARTRRHATELREAQAWFDREVGELRLGQTVIASERS